MAGIHEIVRETPKPQRPPALPPGELLAELRRRVVRFEDFASMNCELTRLVEARLEDLTDATNPAA
jgi:hypothetical protein